MRERLESTYEITPYDSDVIVNQGQSFVAYFVELADAVKDGKSAANWVTQDVLRVLNDQNQSIEQFPIRAAALTDLIRRVQAGDFNTSRAREVFAEMLAGKSVADAVAALGITKVDESELIALADEILAGQSENRRRHQIGQSPSGWQSDRSGKKAKSEREPGAVSGDLFGAGGKDVMADFNDSLFERHRFECPQSSLSPPISAPAARMWRR